MQQGAAWVVWFEGRQRGSLLQTVSRVFSPFCSSHPCKQDLIGSTFWWDVVGGTGFKTEKGGAHASTCKSSLSGWIMKTAFQLNLQIYDTGLASVSKLSPRGNEYNAVTFHSAPKSQGWLRVLCLPSAEWLALTDRAFQGKSRAPTTTTHFHSPAAWGRSSSADGSGLCSAINHLKSKCVWVLQVIAHKNYEVADCVAGEIPSLRGPPYL